MKSLLLLTSALSCVSSGVYSSNSRSNTTRQHTVEEDTYSITYKYDSNIVRSNEDIITGNVYYFYCNDYETFSRGNEYNFSILNIYFSNFDESINTLDENYYSDIVCVDSTIGMFTTGYVFFYNGNDSYTSYSIVQQGLQFNAMVIINDFSSMNQDAYTFFTRVEDEDIPILSVSPIYDNTSVLGYVYDFVYQEIFNFPQLERYSFNVFETKTSLRSWLSISTCLIIGFLLIWLLIWFIRYIFRLISGLLH